MIKILKTSLAALMVASSFAATASTASAERLHKQKRAKVIATADQSFERAVQCNPEAIIVPIVLGAALGAGIGAVAGAIAFTTIPVGTVALGAGTGVGVGVVSGHGRC